MAVVVEAVPVVVEAVAVVFDQRSEPCEQPAIALRTEHVDKIVLGGLGPPSHRPSASSPLRGQIERTAPSVLWIRARLAEIRGYERGREALGVHGVSPQLTGKLADALTGLSGDEPEQCRLWRAQTKPSELGLPGPATCPVCHAKQEAKALGHQVGIWS